MAEPATTAGATLASSAAAVPSLVAFGVPLGLRPDILIAGFAGAIVAIVLLNSVPSTGDTWRALLRTSLRRMLVSCASSLTAGYLTPLVLLAVNMPAPLLLAMAFLVGAGAQRYLAKYMNRYVRVIGKPGEGAL